MSRLMVGKIVKGNLVEGKAYVNDEMIGLEELQATFVNTREEDTTVTQVIAPKATELVGDNDVMLNIINTNSRKAREQRLIDTQPKKKVNKKAKVVRNIVRLTIATGVMSGLTILGGLVDLV